MMKNYYRYKTKKNRIKRHAGIIVYDIVIACMLIIIVTLVGGLFIYGFNCLFTAPHLAIREIEVRGLEELTEKEILQLAGIYPAQNILAVNLRKSARQIKVNPWVKEVSIARFLPDKITISVKERKAAALLKKNDRLVVLDSNGFSFKPLGNEDKFDLPVLTGMFESVEEIDRELFKRSIELAGLFTTEMANSAAGLLSEVHTSEVYGLSLYTDRGMCLHFGFGDYHIKMARLKTVLDDLGKKELLKGFLRLDLSDPDKVIVEWKDISQPKRNTKLPDGLRI